MTRQSNKESANASVIEKDSAQEPLEKPSFSWDELINSPVILVLPFFFWGTAMVAMKGALANTTPFFVAGTRLVPAGLLVLIVSYGLRRPAPITWQAWAWILGFALVDAALFQGFLAQGLTLTSAGLGSVMIDSQPLAVAVLARWLYGEVVGFWGWLGLVIGLVGISVIGLPDSWIQSLVTSEFWMEKLQGMGSGFSATTVSWEEVLDIVGRIWSSGEWWMLLAAIAMAVGTVMMRTISRYADPLMATGFHMVLGGLPLFALSAGLETNQWNALTVSDWVGLVYTAVFGGAIAYGLFFFLAAKGNLTSLSSLTFLTPVFALFFGGVLLSESLTSVQGSGVLLTLISVVLVNRREQLKMWMKPLGSQILHRE
ncbi:MAG: DMT family transporter [Cyanobacteria bacterium P01_C01_bin.89]